MATMNASSSGECTYPLQPCFSVEPSTELTNVTGDGTVYQIAFDTEIFDQGSNFASNTFTAPVSGRFFFQAIIGVRNLTTGHTKGIAIITTSNRSYNCDSMNPGVLVNSTSFPVTFSTSVLADMDAGDTAYIALAVYNSTKTVSIRSLTSTKFNGKLIA